MSQTYKDYSLPKYQKLINELAAQRGFDKEILSQKFMLLLEEAGEFAKAARKMSGIKVDENSKKHAVEEEAADVFWVLLDLCNKLNIDLAGAFKDKEDKNKNRTWN
jgi:NTP pyrophosphatase (non-canonical NTP hydrolase)